MSQTAPVRRKPQAVVEIVFDVAYLLFSVAAGCYMLLSAGGESGALRLYGILALVLGGGDAFHLIPRIYGSWRGDLAPYTRALGLGKLVTSLTMTAFYVLLYHVWLVAYQLPAAATTALVYGLAAVRVALCLFPQNRWLHDDAPLRWAVYRNIPFLILGLLVLALFAVTAAPAGDLFRFMPLAIALSFAFYIPVVLGAQKHPALGALMLPKTLAYVWILCMGLGLR